VAFGQQPHHGKELKATPNPAAKNGIMASAGYKFFHGTDENWDLNINIIYIYKDI